jgi:hypothetical protein
MVSWHSSSASNAGGESVEVTRIAGEVWVRDSKDPEGPILKLRREGWAAFIAGLRYATLGPPALTILVIISGLVTVHDRLTIRQRVRMWNRARSLRSSGGADQWWVRKRSALLFPSFPAARLAS